MTLLEAGLLGIIQGITEFLPISSTGHLILARTLFGLGVDYGLAFDAILHLATALAVIVYFRKDIYNLIQVSFRSLNGLPVNRTDSVLLRAILLGTIPAVVLGLSLENIMETAFQNPLLVALVLVLGSLFFMYAEWHYLLHTEHRPLTAKKGLLIGLFQALALVPGTSRSGITIAGGMWLGLSRETSARFAFLLSIPIILGAGGKKLLELIVQDVPVFWSAVGVGALIAFVTGIIAIHFMLGFIRRRSLWLFIWYRIFLAIFVVLLVLYE